MEFLKKKKNKSYKTAFVVTFIGERTGHTWSHNELQIVQSK